MIENEPAVDSLPSAEHMAMPSGAALAEKPHLSVIGKGVDMPREEYQPPPVAGSESNLFLTEFGLGDDFVNSADEWAPGIGAISATDLAAIDSRDKVAVANELRGFWGDDYAPNIQKITAFLGQRLAPSDRQFLEAMRDRDGTAVLNQAGTLQKILIAANRAESVGLHGSADDQIKQIERIMREDRRSYDKDESLQARYRELLARRKG